VISDIHDYLLANNSPLNLNDVQNIFAIYNFSGNGRLTFDEFKTSIYPQEN